MQGEQSSQTMMPAQEFSLAGDQSGLAPSPECQAEIGAWLVVKPSSPSHLGLFSRTSELGYRALPRLMDGTYLFVRGQRIDLAESRHCSAIVIGCTTVSDPAKRLLEAIERSGSSLRAQFAVVGHFAAVVDSPRGVCVVTDHVGSISVHAAESEPKGLGRVVGTDLSDVAELSGRRRIDPVSAREFIVRGAITFPNTIREGVFRCPPGSVITVAHDRLESTHYWTPSTPDRTPDSLEDVAVHGREIMMSNLQSTIANLARVTIFFSGGEDCRVLGSLLRKTAPAALRLRAVTFLDHPNREQRLARWSARLLGLPLETRFRSPSHYVESIHRGLRLTGGGIDLTHNHAMGLVNPLEADLFIDGWTADSYLKGWALEHSLATGVSLTGDREPCDEIDSAVVERRVRRLKELQDLRGEDDAPSWLSLWPISDHLDFGNLGVNLRARPSISPYMFGNFVDAIRAVREHQKFGRGIFWPMFGRTMGLAGWIPRSGGELPALQPRWSGMPTRVVRRLFRLEDRMLQRLGRFRSQGPWQSVDMTDQAFARFERTIDQERLDAARNYLSHRQLDPSRSAHAGVRHRIAQLSMLT